MATDTLDLYRQAGAWTTEKVAGAADQLDAPTPCDEWDLRTLLDHVLETQQFFTASGRGEEASPPSPQPPRLVSDDPVADLEQARQDIETTFSDPEVSERSGFLLGVAFSDMLLHGWDVAKATGQDAEMPAGLAEAAFDTIHGKFTDEQRAGLFKPEVTVADDAPAQDKLLAYTGRDPR